MKVETHNHPTAISPYPGAATGSGGEIRDEGATGRGAQAQGGPDRLLASPTCACRARCAPGRATTASPRASPRALDIMLEGPLGGAAFNNEFGRPNLAGYFRTFELEAPGPAAREVRGYHKPIMLAGGLGNIRAEHVKKGEIPPGAAIVVLGGPAMLIGLGGGAASSMASGASHEDLDFASVQRDNAEMERRCQEVIDRCWALGDDNPIVSIHDVGAGGLSNALPELVQRQRARRALRAARDPERRAGHVAARDLVQRSAGALRAGDRARALAQLRSALRARALPVRGGRHTPPTTACSWSTTRTSAISRSTCRCRCCSASRRR